MERIRADQFDVAAPGANTNILNDSLTPTATCLMRVTVALNAASVFNVTFTRGGSTRTFGLNGSVALAANDLYIFDFNVSVLDVINFQVETDTIIRKLHVSEIQNSDGA